MKDEEVHKVKDKVIREVAKVDKDMVRSRIQGQINAGGDNSVGCWLLSGGEMLDDDQVVAEK